MICVTCLLLTMRRSNMYANLPRTFAESKGGDEGSPSQSFFRFCAKEYFFFFFHRLIDPPITPINADLNILPGSARVGILFFCDITSPVPPLLSPPIIDAVARNRKIDNLHLRFSRLQENKGALRKYIIYVCVVVLTARSVARIRRGTTLGTDRTVHLGGRHCLTSNYWAARPVPGTAFWNEHEFTVSVSFWYGPSYAQPRFATPKVFLNLSRRLIMNGVSP